MSESWPPPVGPGDVYRDVVINERERGRKVTGRVVRLWGKSVVIDDAGDVFCDWCHQFVPVAELGSPNNSHGVGLRPTPGAIVTSVDHGNGESGSGFFR